jgi:hypothetical protein
LPHVFQGFFMLETKVAKPMQQPAVEELALEDLQQVGGGVVPGSDGTG